MRGAGEGPDTFLDRSATSYILQCTLALMTQKRCPYQPRPKDVQASALSRPDLMHCPQENLVKGDRWKVNEAETFMFVL